MSAIILKIGDTDLSDVTEQEQVRISTSPVFGKSFTNVLGETVRKCLGVKIDISAEFHLMDERAAGAVVAACSADKVSVTYLDPFEVSAEFERPSVTVVPIFEDGEEVIYWNISLSMTCPLKGNGL